MNNIIRLSLVLCTALAMLAATHPRALAQEEDVGAGATEGAAALAVGRDDEGAASGKTPSIAQGPAAAVLSRRTPSSKAGAQHAELARERAIGKGSKPATPGDGRADGGGGPDQTTSPQQQQQQPQQKVPSSAAAAARQERLRTSGAAGTGSGGPSAADYTYIPVDGRVLLRPRSLSKLRDYAADVYGGISEVAQAQPFFGAASVSGRVGLAARYNLDYSDYLSPRQINARFGPTSHVATVATGRAQGTAGAKAATDSVATRRASYRLDVADGMAFESGLVSQRLNAASGHVTVERDQANDPFYATVADPGAGLIGKKKRRR